MYEVIFEVYYGTKNTRPVFKTFFRFESMGTAISFVANQAVYERGASAPENGLVTINATIKPL